MQAPEHSKLHFPHWLAGIIAASGGLGLCVLSFLDSSFLPFPTLNDLLLMDLSARFPLRMPYYALMATLGAMGGGLVLYAIARKGEEAFVRKHPGPRAERVHAWVKKNGFLAVAIGALLPPPFPFKIVIVAAGALEMPLGVFVCAMLLARLIRFFGEGILAVKYGSAALPYLLAHKVSMTLGSLVVAVGFYLTVHFAFRPAKGEQA